MNLYDLVRQQEVTLSINMNQKHLAFETNIQEIFPEKQLLIVDPIYHDGKIITFNIPELTVDIIVYPENEAPQVFKKAKITLTRKPDGSYCYVLSATKESRKHNRREHFRCFVGLPTSVRSETNGIAHEAIIRDVSIRGFSITCDKSVKIQEGQYIDIMLKDYIRESAESYLFNFHGKVVRAQELDHNKMLYGCRLNKAIDGLESYIIRKERVQLKRNNDTKGSRKV